MAASTRKNPLLWGRENIFVTQHGIAHAIYALTGLPYGFALKEDKIAARAAHQSLYQRLHGEYTIYSLIADTDPLSIIKSMTEGIHLPDYPGWVNETKLTMEKLENSPSGERMFFITFPLSTWSQPVNRVRDSVWAAHQPVQSHLGLPVVPPSDEMFGRWKRRARELSMRIPVAFNPVPVSMKAVQWIWDHAQMRGIGTEDPYPMDARITAENRADGWVNLRSLPEPLLDEGGMSDVDGVSGRVEAFKRRYVKVEHPLGAPTYQTQMIMSATPVGGFVFPGGEFLEAVNKLPVDCEFVLRVKVQSKHKANQDSARSESNIEDQLFQQDGSGNRISGGLSQLAQASKLLEEFVESLNASEREVKVSASMIFSVSGPTPELVEAQANEVQTFFGGSEFVLDAPVGDQRRLWWDMLPGTMASSITNELTQITTGYDFSIGVPLVETQLGENHGFLIGENLSSGRNTPVFMSPGGNAEANRSGSFGAVGDLGSGKSAFLKTVAAHTINRGGQVIAVDNSENQEWAKLAKAMTEVVVLDFENPQYSLDPIRNSDSPEEAAQQVMDLLSMLFGLNAFTPVGAAIDSVLNPETNPHFEEITSMSKLRDALEEGRGVPDNLIEGAQEAAVKLAILSRKRHMRYLFDDSLPVLDLDAPAIIFATHGMDLPSENDLSTAEMRAQMTLTKKIGYATYGHIAAISYQLATHDDSRESIFIVDEAAHLTASPEACHRVEQFISRGRKHKAAIGLGSHSALDFGSAKLRSLILHRFLFRTADQDLANVNLSWLQKGYDTAEYRDLLAGLSPDEEEERRGECIYRDVQSRIGKIKIQLPLDPKTRQATLTTPPSTRKKKQQVFADRSLVEA